MKARLVCDAFKMALWQRGPPAGLIHRSDRGAPYASHTVRRLLGTNSVRGSMSRQGDGYDHAVAKSFFGSLKQDRVQWRHYQTRQEAQQDILQYIAMFYNRYRLHATLGYISPHDFEKQFGQGKKLLNRGVSKTLTRSFQDLMGRMQRGERHGQRKAV